jgi:hypothetical protein
VGGVRNEGLKLVDGVGWEGGGALAEPEAGPGLGDQDAVAGVTGVVAELDGLVDAVTEDEFGELGDVLRAVVGDAGKAVAVEEDVGRGGNAVFAVEAARIDEVAVGDAADEGEIFAAAAFELVRRGTAGADVVNGASGKDEDACGDAAENPGVLVGDQLREVFEVATHGGEIRIA